MGAVPWPSAGLEPANAELLEAGELGFITGSALAGDAPGPYPTCRDALGAAFQRLAQGLCNEAETYDHG